MPLPLTFEIASGSKQCAALRDTDQRNNHYTSQERYRFFLFFFRILAVNVFQPTQNENSSLHGGGGEANIYKKITFHLHISRAVPDHDNAVIVELLRQPVDQQQGGRGGWGDRGNFVLAPRVETLQNNYKTLFCHSRGNVFCTTKACLRARLCWVQCHYALRLRQELPLRAEATLRAFISVLF